MLALPVIRNSFFAKPPRLCVDNLKQWGQCLSMYRNDYVTADPPLHGFEKIDESEAWQGCENVNPNFNFIPDMGLMIPEYMNDLGLLSCPDSIYSHPAKKAGPFLLSPASGPTTELGVVSKSAFSPCAHDGLVTNGDVSYTYLGFMIDRAGDSDLQVDEATARRLNLPATGPAQVVAVLRQLEEDVVRNEEPRLVDVDLREYFTSGDWGLMTNGNRLLVELPDWPFIGRNYYGMTESEGGAANTKPVKREWHSRVPTMWDTIYQDANGMPIFSHKNPEGVNVLYMDGHVEFVPYPSRFPASTAFATMKRIR